MDIVVGQKVWLIPEGNAARYNPNIREKEVTSIGKKYVYCDDLRFDKKTLKYAGDGNSGYIFFSSEQSCRDYLESVILNRSIRDYFHGYGKSMLPLESLRTIHSLINTPQQ